MTGQDEPRRGIPRVQLFPDEMPRQVEETPWIQLQAHTAGEARGAAAFRTGWLQGKADAGSRRRCPWRTGIARAAWFAAKAYASELDR